MDAEAIYAGGIVSLCNHLTGAFRALGKPIFLLSLIAYLFLTGSIIKGLLQHLCPHLELWLLSTGLLLSAFVLRFGTALFTSWFPEEMVRYINPFYSCGAYILLSLFKYMTLLTAFSTARKLRKKN